jgi:hypothetical protein
MGLTLKLLCGARRKGGRGFCQQPPVPGKMRCFYHGGAPGAGSRKGEDRPLRALRSQIGYALWKAENPELCLAHRAKARLIGGRNRASRATRDDKGRFLPNSRPRARYDAIVEKALQRIAHVVAEIEGEQKNGNLPAPGSKPWEAQSRGERMVSLTVLALEKWRGVLEPIIDPIETASSPPPRMKLLQLQLDTARSIMTAQIRLGDHVLGRQEPDRSAEFLTELEKTREEMRRG